MLLPTDENEIIEKINRFKNTSGYDAISVCDIKQTKDLLAMLINKSFEHCCFPNALKKQSYVLSSNLVRTPIHQITDRLHFSQINLTKIHEKRLKKRIVNFLERTHETDNHQFGFLNNSSTQAHRYCMLCNVSMKD